MAEYFLSTVGITVSCLHYKLDAGGVGSVFICEVTF